MKIVIRYKDDRLDIFDTATFTASKPFAGKSMLTNFEVRIDSLGNTGLWLIAHYYEVSEAIAKKTAEGETPVAHRKRGWRFLLAEERELPDIESVSIDGELALMRIEGELVDMIRLNQMGEVWLDGSTNQCAAHKALLLFDQMCRTYPDLAVDNEKLSRLCGMSHDVMDKLRDQFILPENKASGDEDWIKGLNEVTDTVF